MTDLVTIVKGNGSKNRVKTDGLTDVIDYSAL